MKVLYILIASLMVTPALAWNGQDTDLGTSIMISSRDVATCLLYTSDAADERVRV